MPRVFTSRRQKTGEIGETIAAKYLISHGYNVIERNYTKPWGEIDIVAIMDETLYFIEVKTVSRERNASYEYKNYRPEENMNPYKVRKIYRTIEIYLSDRNVPEIMDWQLDLICVYLDPAKRQAKVKRIENIIG